MSDNPPRAPFPIRFFAHLPFAPLLICLFAILLPLLSACVLPARKSPTTQPSALLSPTPIITTGYPTIRPSDYPTHTPTPVPTPTPLPATRIASGDRALFLGDWDAALSAYQAALASSADPETTAAALLGLGRTRLLMGDYPGAVDTLLSLLDGYPASSHRPEAFFFLGQAYHAQSRYGDAAGAYLSYLALRHGLIDAYLYERRGDALFAAGDFASALTDYQAALQSPQTSQNLPLEIKIARTYAIRGDAASALPIYDSVYARASSDHLKAQVDVLKAQAYTALGLANDAYNAYLDAVNNYPTVYDSYLALVELVNAGYPVDELQRGKVDYYAGQYTVALAAFTRYLNASPYDPATAHYYAGLTLREMGDTAAAIQHWDTVIQNYPDSSVWDDACEEKAYTQWAYLGQYPEGEQTLLGFVSAAPGHARAAEFLFDAARIAERDGRLEEAAQLWERLAAEYPVSEYTYKALFLAGIARYRLGDYPAAQAVFLRAQSLAADVSRSSAAYFWVGKCQNALRDATAARATWEQTAALDPTGYYSERARDLLAGRAPFAPPDAFDQAYDLAAERAEAETWLRATFSLPAEVDLSGPGLLASDPRFQRGEEFWRLGLYEQARAELENLRLSQQSDPANSFRLASYFVQIGLYRSAILSARQVLSLAGMDDAATQTAPVYFNRLRFGTYYPELVVPAAQSYGFHPLFVWSVVRQESFFEGFIQSPAGARGLMQIIPSTGQSIADETGWPPGYTADDLYRPLVSVNLGLYYLDQQLDSFDGDLYAALAAYNAGPGNAAVWKELSGDDPDLFLEVVRYDETRTYIMSIYEMYTIYRRLYSRTQ